MHTCREGAEDEATDSVGEAVASLTERITLNPREIRANIFRAVVLGRNIATTEMDRSEDVQEYSRRYLP